MFKKISRWFRRPRTSSGYVYYIKLKVEGVDYYKLGFTTKNSIQERFSYSGHGDEKLVDTVFFFTYCKNAWDIEQKLLDEFKNHKAFKKYSNDASKPLPGRGQTELFRQDVLGLDEARYSLLGERLTSASSENDAGNGCLVLLLGLCLAPFTLGISLFFIVGGLVEMFGAKHTEITLPSRPSLSPETSCLIHELRQHSRIQEL